MIELEIPNAILSFMFIVHLRSSLLIYLVGFFIRARAKKNLDLVNEVVWREVGQKRVRLHPSAL